jgi:hypothetical protein
MQSRVSHGSCRRLYMHAAAHTPARKWSLRLPLYWSVEQWIETKQGCNPSRSPGKKNKVAIVEAPDTLYQEWNLRDATEAPKDSDSTVLTTAVCMRLNAADHGDGTQTRKPVCDESMIVEVVEVGVVQSEWWWELDD